MPKRIAIVAVVLLLAGAAWWALGRHGGPRPYTGFVEGEERIVRAEVSGRVLEVPFAEGDRVPAGAVVARLDDGDIAAKLRAKEAEVATLAAQVRRQDEQIQLVESTWRRERAAQAAGVQEAEAVATRTARSFAREQELVATGASTKQRLDDERALRDQAASALARAREMLGRADAAEREIAVARHQRDVLAEQQKTAEAQADELRVQRAKCEIRAPATETVVQTQLLWPGELAQPGTPVVALLDPRDKYVQLYLPVADVAHFPVGQKVEFELDSRPGRRYPGEVSFVADKANFTPEKIETRDDRLGQVYRAKIRITEGVEQLQPGTEGNVWLGTTTP
jgi:HlyD family secretion protein